MHAVNKAPRSRGPFVWLALQTLVVVGATIYLAQFVADEITRPMCFEEPGYQEPGTSTKASCDLLVNFGFTLIQAAFIPPGDYPWATGR